MAGVGLDPAQLRGFVVGITADRRAEELASALRRRGAQVVQAPTLRITPVEDDVELVGATRGVINDPPDDVVVTTGIGFRGWVEAGDAAGLAPALLATLDRARLLARGPKARGAIRAAGLVEDWAAVSETTQEVLQHLLAGGVRGRRVVVQQHGERDTRAVEVLREHGASVREVNVYRWGPSREPAAVARLVHATAAGSVDAVAFTSAPAATAFLDAASECGEHGHVLTALRGPVLAGAVGPVTARPLLDVGIHPLVPDRSRLGALVRAMAEELVERSRPLCTAAGPLQVRGAGAVLDGRLLPLPPAPLSVLRYLASVGGAVLTRSDLLAALPGAADEHAVEVAVGRLRSAVGPHVVETVVKRGYRLAVEA